MELQTVARQLIHRIRHPLFFSLDRLLLQKSPERRKQVSDEHQDPNAAAKHVVIGKQSLPAVAENIMTRKNSKATLRATHAMPNNKASRPFFGPIHAIEIQARNNRCAQIRCAYDMPCLLTEAWFK